MDIQDHEYDVVIVGGGPAGSSTALSLLKKDPNLRVALLEKTALEMKRVGEILKPAAKTLLQDLGVWEVFLAEKYPCTGETRSAWGTEKLVDNELTFEPANRGWDIDRRAFDSLLFRQAGEKGVSPFSHFEVTQFERNANTGWLLNVQGPDQEKHIFNTSFLVDATGQSPFFALKQGAKKIRFDRLVGVFVIFQFNSDTNADPCVMAETVPHGWWYSVPLPGNHIIAAFMTDNDIVGDLDLVQSKNWWGLLEESHHTHDRVKSSVPVTDFCMRIADSYCLDQVQGEGWASVGDATGRMDPLSGHGMYWAMQSGINLAQPILNWLKGDNQALGIYQARMDEDYGNYLYERKTVYSLEKRWAENPFWQRRQESESLDPFLKEYLSKSRFCSEPLETFHFFHSFQNKTPL